MKITVAGAGYVGLANAILLSQHNEVILLDISPEKIECINQKKSPIQDVEIDYYLANKPLNIRATLDAHEAFSNADFVVVAIPSNYEEESKEFNTSEIEAVIADALSIAAQAVIVIKSTVPIGYTEQLRGALTLRHQRSVEVIFCPEFLREGKALHDNLYPSRIVIGDQGPHGKTFAQLLKQGALRPDVPVIYTSSTEAEAIKLFSNTYLAMRVAYFNELDSYAASHGLDTQRIIHGVCLDPRMGDYYNNPSFGYGGYCLPKDTKQLLRNYLDVPQNLIQAIVDANTTRQQFIARDILKKNPKTVGIHRLVMKHQAENIRASSVQGIIQILKTSGIEIIIYEPALKEKTFFQSSVIDDLSDFKKNADIILTNRMATELNDVKSKVYTRDIFGTN